MVNSPSGGARAVLVHLGTPGNAIADVGPVPVHGESMVAENMTHAHERGVQTARVSYF